MRSCASVFGVDRCVVSVLAILGSLLLLLSLPVTADPYPPTLTNGAAHFPVAAWPAEGQWVPYTSGGDTLNDPRVQDPSNGGTDPQNYVNVSSCMPDKSAPSVYWYFNTSNSTLTGCVRRRATGRCRGLMSWRRRRTT